MIYKLAKDFENTFSVLIEGEELYSKMPTYSPRFLATARSASWNMPEGSFYRSENFTGADDASPNISLFATGVLVLDRTAHEQFSKKLTPTGEFLPVSINGEHYYLFNVLYVVPDDAVNLSAAVEKIDSCVHLGQSNVTFDEEFLNEKDILIFKTKTDKLIFSYCTQAFKDQYESYGFKGIIFEPAWLIEAMNKMRFSETARFNRWPASQINIKFEGLLCLY